MGPAAPSQGVAGHLRQHPRSVVDEGYSPNHLLAGVVPLRGEDDVDPSRARLYRVVDDPAAGGVPVSALTLRLQRLLGVEEREHEVLGQLVEVLTLPLNLGQ